MKAVDTTVPGEPPFTLRAWVPRYYIAAHPLGASNLAARTGPEVVPPCNRDSDARNRNGRSGRSRGTAACGNPFADLATRVKGVVGVRPIIQAFQPYGWMGWRGRQGTPACCPMLLVEDNQHKLNIGGSAMAGAVKVASHPANLQTLEKLQAMRLVLDTRRVWPSDVLNRQPSACKSERKCPRLADQPPAQ